MAAAAWLALGMAGTAMADAGVAEELAALKAEMARLRARVSELEARLVEATGEADDDAPAAAAAAAVAATPAAPPAPSLSPARELSVGGRIKLDTVYTSVSAGDNAATDLFLSPGVIPLDDAGEQDQVRFTARSSRLWLKSWQPTPLGDAAAYLEFDLYGGGGNQRATNSYNVRLRHGYGEFGGFLFGQTYTTFMDATALPEHNDDGSAAGGILVRQPMLRYTTAAAGGQLSFAIENPETTLAAADDVLLAPDDDRMPDLIARYGRRAAGDSWALALMAREIRADRNGQSDSAFGLAASLSGSVALGAADRLRFAATGGNAVGRYMSFNAFPSGRLDATGDIALTPSAGGYLSLTHLWSREWRSNLTAGYAWQDGDDAFGAENEHVYTVHANLLWSPLISTTLGLEGIYGARERFDGRDGEQFRLQFSTLHKF
ncbi:MAG: DcaP family trimeric outer membrane transporter [Gammaproteobacteria bacterium]